MPNPTLVTVVNVRRTDRFDLYVGRTCGAHKSEGFGNHFVVGKHGERGECCKLFDEWFYSDSLLAKLRREKCRKRIKPGDALGCWCAPADCHANTYAEYVNSGFLNKRTSEKEC